MADGVDLVGHDAVDAVVGAVLEVHLGQRAEVGLLGFVAAFVEQAAVFQEDVGKAHLQQPSVDEVDGGGLEFLVYRK